MFRNLICRCSSRANSPPNLLANGNSPKTKYARKVGIAGSSSIAIYKELCKERQKVHACVNIKKNTCNRKRLKEKCFSSVAVKFPFKNNFT